MWMGIDLGTSGVKVVLVDRAQAIKAEAHAGLSVSRPAPNWSEQDPEDWWAATCKCLDTLAAQEPDLMGRVAGIGLSGQMHGAVLLDQAGSVLRPAILWNDTRAHEDCLALEARADFRGIGGNIVMPGFTAPKLAWVASHEPEIFAATQKVLLPKDYLRFRLSGAFVSEMSDAAGTLWLDVAARDWSDTLLAATGLARGHMPDLVEGSAPSAALLPDLAARWGIARAPVIAGGAGDNAASAAGVGATRPGQGFLSIGTSGVLFATTDRFAPNTDGAVHAFCHALPDTWHQMGVMLSATDSLNWLANLFDTEAETLAEEASGVSDTGGVTFLPYLSGERTPHNLAAPEGGFAGLSHRSSRAHLARAVMEGVAFGFADCRDALAAAGTRFETVFAVGGGARSRAWLQWIANATGLTLAIPSHGDFGAAFGAARLAMVASGAGTAEAIMTPPDIIAEVAPDDDAPQLLARRDRFRAHSRAIREAQS